MRKQLCFVAMVILVSCGSKNSVTYQNGTVEELGKSLFQAIKSDDIKGLSAFLLTEEDVTKNTLKMNAKDQEIERSYVTNDLSHPDLILQDIKRKFASMGLTDWSKAVFERVTYDGDTENGITVIRRCEIYFKNKSYTGIIRIHHAYESDRGWVITRKPIHDDYSDK